MFKDEDAKFVTTSFINFEQIESISKFRSCSGHNSGRIFNKAEPISSLKHYIQPKNEYFGTEDQVKVLAPFDGKIVLISSKFNNERGQSMLLRPYNELWTLGLTHVNPLPELKRGDKFSAGDLLAYASTGKDHPPYPASFDVGVNYFWQLDLGVDSVFNHMTDEALMEFAKYNVTIENIIVSLEERLSKPCDCYERGDTECGFRTSVEDPEHVVKLRKVE